MPKKFNHPFYIVLFFWNFINPVSYPIAWADEIQAAVATNFHNPFKAVVKQFEKKTAHKVIIIAGSTGKLYAQITNGAPFREISIPSNPEAMTAIAHEPESWVITEQKASR